MTTETDYNPDATPSVNDFINLANYVYTSGKDPSSFPLTDYKPLTTFKGRLVYRLDSTDGFYGQAFVSTGTSDPSVIIAFEGTNLAHNPPNALFTAGQVIDDGDIYEGKNAPSYATALKFAQTAIKDAETHGVSSANIYLDGHSLGGAEAEYVDTQTHLKGVTFGAPGIPVSDIGSIPSKLTNFVDYGDPVGNYTDDPPKLLGSFVHANAIEHYGTEQYTGKPSDSSLLATISHEWSSGLFGKIDAVKDFAADFSSNHVLSHYANDLHHKYHTKLPGSDLTTGSDAFLGPIRQISGLATEFDAMACFASGTRIDTTRGRVAVETLSTDDEVITASGERRAIRWLGHRAVDCRRHPRPQDVLPVRIAAHAFGPNRPARDLYVSPGHAICVDVEGEVLVPAYALIDGTSIAQVAVDTVTYWHVELASHDIIVSENLPSESYLDTGNRDFFVEAEVPALNGVPDVPRRSHADFCRPFVAGGPIVDAVRERLRRRALRLQRAA